MKQITFEICMFFLILQLSTSCVDDRDSGTDVDDDGERTFEFYFSSPEELEQKIRDNVELQNFLKENLEREAADCVSPNLATTGMTSDILISTTLSQVSTNPPNTEMEKKTTPQPSTTEKKTTKQTTEETTTTPIPTTTAELTQTTSPVSCDEKYSTPSTTDGEGCLGGKCFNVTYSVYKNKNYEDAKQMCKDIGSDWNLANIYDQCYFDFIKEYLMKNKNPHSEDEFRVWIGMTFKNLTTYFLSGEEATFGNWWYPVGNYPLKASKNTHLAIRHNDPEFGVMNQPPANSLRGALCEKSNTLNDD